ncbi:MAG: hypothetical protein IT209_08375 [Armatimonadetes bacterium]|nr:hypothetical protein [Armatimonadota bacterium]
MNKTITGGLLAALLASQAVLAAPVKPSKSAKPDTTVYQVSAKSPQGDMGPRSMTIKGDFFYWDMDSPGIRLQAIKNSKGTFMVNSARKFIVEYPRGTLRDTPMSYVPGPIGNVQKFLQSQGARKVGTEKIGGKPANVYTYTESKTKWKCKLWVRPVSYEPLKLITTGVKATDTVTYTYKSYKTGVPVADSKFDLPKGMTMRKMPDYGEKKAG